MRPDVLILLLYGKLFFYDNIIASSSPLELFHFQRVLIYLSPKNAIKFSAINLMHIHVKDCAVG